MAFATYEEALVAQYYPGMLALFRTSPEIQLYLTQSVRENWTKERTEAVLLNTDWWKSTPGPAREALNLQLTDPASWNIQVANRANLLTMEAARMGWILPSNLAHFYAGTGFNNGLTDEQLMQRLVLEQGPDPKNAAGALGEAFHKAKALAGEWGITVGDNEASLIAKGMLAYGQDETVLSDFARDKALKQFAANTGLVDAIKNQGVTVREYASPYIDMAAAELELNPAQIDLSHPSWQRAIHTKDPESGAWGAMNLQDWQKTLRTDGIWGPMHNRTQAATVEAIQMAEQINQTMGARA